MLTIQLVHAKNLIGRTQSNLPDNGVSNPYVIFQLPGGRIRKSKVKKETINPIWNQEITLPVTFDKRNLENVRIFVYDDSDAHLNDESKAIGFT